MAQTKTRRLSLKAGAVVNAPITPAISIRLPWVELILRGEKRYAFRSRPTSIRERVYRYASPTPADIPERWEYVGKEPSALATGMIVGSVEMVDCLIDEEGGGYAYEVARPKHLAKPLMARNQPQPGFWKPAF
jgi:hypothetical protein